MTKIRSKTTTKKQNTILALLAIGVIGSLTFAASSTYLLADANEQKEDIPEAVISFNEKDYLQRDGVRSVISVNHQSDSFDVVRGSHTDTTFVLTHEANNVNAKAVTLEMDGTIGVITPEPYASMYTSEERVKQLQENGKITGSISLSEYVTYSPDRVTLAPGESVVVTMKVDIPQNFDDSLMLKMLPFQPNIIKVGDDLSERNIRVDNAIINGQILLSEGGSS